MFFVVATAKIFFIILCVKQIAHILELCKVLHLFHVCPGGSSDHDREGAEMEEQDITSFFFNKGCINPLCRKLQSMVNGGRRLSEKENYVSSSSIVFFHIFCTRR